MFEGVAVLVPVSRNFSLSVNRGAVLDAVPRIFTRDAVGNVVVAADCQRITCVARERNFFARVECRRVECDCARACVEGADFRRADFERRAVECRCTGDAQAADCELLFGAVCKVVGAVRRVPGDLVVGEVVALILTVGVEGDRAVINRREAVAVCRFSRADRADWRLTCRKLERLAVGDCERACAENFRALDGDCRIVFGNADVVVRQLRVCLQAVEFENFNVVVGGRVVVSLNVVAGRRVISGSRLQILRAGRRSVFAPLVG